MHHQARAQFRIYLRKPVRHYQLYSGHVTSFPPGWSKFSSLWIQSLLSIPINHISHINATLFQQAKIIGFVRFRRFQKAAKRILAMWNSTGWPISSQPIPGFVQNGLCPAAYTLPPGPYALRLEPYASNEALLPPPTGPEAPSPTPHAPCRLQACKSGQQIPLANQTNCI